jgi:hypothetical protein
LRALSKAGVDLHKQLKAQVLGWAAIERARRRQSSRVTHIREGGACTKFFHQRAKGRRKRNLIACLKNASDVLVWKHSEKELILDQYFRGILGKKCTRHHTLNWQNLNLSRLQMPDLDHNFNLEELKHVVQELPAEKAPGPNGFTRAFYENC